MLADYQATSSGSQKTLLVIFACSACRNRRAGRRHPTAWISYCIMAGCGRPGSMSKCLSLHDLCCMDRLSTMEQASSRWTSSHSHKSDALLTHLQAGAQRRALREGRHHCVSAFPKGAFTMRKHILPPLPACWFQNDSCPWLWGPQRLEQRCPTQPAPGQTPASFACAVGDGTTLSISLMLPMPTLSCTAANS